VVVVVGTVVVGSSVVVVVVVVVGSRPSRDRVVSVLVLVPPSKRAVATPGTVGATVGAVSVGVIVARAVAGRVMVTVAGAVGTRVVTLNPAGVTAGTVAVGRSVGVVGNKTFAPL